MVVAGHTGALPFDARALHRIHQLSRGVPRRVNLLCDRALLGAYATGQAMVDQTIAEKAAGEVFGRDIPTLTQVVTAPSRQGLALRIALAAGLLLTGAALAVGVLRWMEPAPSPAAAVPAAVPAKPSATAGVVHEGELSLKPATGVTLPAPTKP
jgi:general secretion pathway protein A